MYGRQVERGLSERLVGMAIIAIDGELGTIGPPQALGQEANVLYPQWQGAPY